MRHRKRKSNNSNTTQSHATPTALNSLLALICLDPSSSSEDSSPSRVVSTTTNKRGIFANILYFPSEPLSAKAEYNLAEAEYAARQSIDATFNNERMQIEARQLFFVTAMGMAEGCINDAIALAALQTEETRARDEITTEYTDEKDMLKDDSVIGNLGNDFQPVSAPITSQPSLFQPAAAASSAPAAKSWIDWLLRR